MSNKDKEHVTRGPDSGQQAAGGKAQDTRNPHGVCHATCDMRGATCNTQHATLGKPVEFSMAIFFLGKIRRNPSKSHM
jgi:hypothetical protein